MNTPRNINVILGILIMALLIVAGKILPERWDQRKRDGTERMRKETDARAAAHSRVEEIRHRMRGMPPGGDLEILAADLRRAEAELAAQK